MGKSRGRSAGQLCSLIMGLYWFGNVMAVAYANVYLLDRGLTNTMVGVILAASGAGSIVVQPILASMVDRSERVTSKRVLLLLFGFTLVCAGMVEFLSNPWLIVGIYILMVSGIYSIPTFINAAILEYAHCGYSVNFSISSSAGSLCYGAGALVIGFLTRRYAVGILMPTFEITLIVCLLVTVLLPHVTVPKGPEKQKEETKQGGYLQLFRSHPKLLVLLFAFFCLWISGINTNNYLIHVVNRVGGDVADLSLATSLGAWLEIPFMLLAGRLSRKRCGTMLIVSGFFYVLKPIIFLLAPNMTWVVLGQMLQGPSFAIYAISSVYYINNMVGQKDLAKAQAVLNVATRGCSGLVANCIAGVLLDYRGVNLLMMVCIGFTMVGFILISWTVTRSYSRN